MHGTIERKAGATFALADVCFIDFESHGRVSIAAGTDRYARSASAIMLSWAVGSQDVDVWSLTADDEYPSSLKWDDAPQALKDFYVRAERGEAVFCAHNAIFDRNIWNLATDFPPMATWMLIDSRAQATASGLPASLEMSCRYVGTDIQKGSEGKRLIDLFTTPASTATPASHPEDWEQFRDYARDDTAAMRELFSRTRQLSLREWKEYWAAERINEVGVSIDLPLVHAAAIMAREDARLTSYVLTMLTNEAVTTVNQVQAIINWLKEVLPPNGKAMLVEREQEIDIETMEILKKEKTALTRNRVVRLIAYLQSLESLTPQLSNALKVLQIRLYGGSKTPAKFSKMLSQHVDGVIRNQYVFNGASQTGRFSARGVQIHNLARDPLPYEMDAIDALAGGANIREFANVGDDTPIARKLSLLIRPSLVASPGYVFCWGDWSNIEARLVPWLADDREADARLDVFRAVDNGTEKYDIYTRTAAQLSGIELHEVTKAIRQRGKVTELAAGFGGGGNALLAMAASYGMHLEEEEAHETIRAWRSDNPWAVRFWGKFDGVGSPQTFGLWGAIGTALGRPGTLIEVGRVAYIFMDNYLGGSLMCRLPSGRWLTYRRIRWEMVEEIDEDTGEVIDVKRELMFSRDMGRIKLWPGLACENVVQAAAADILRGTLVRLDEWWIRPNTAPAPVVLHTHDEVVCETEEQYADEVAQALCAVMEEGFTWSAGLPIAAETVMGRWYTKCEESLGL
jgi:DNA polymerase